MKDRQTFTHRFADFGGVIAGGNQVLDFLVGHLPDSTIQRGVLTWLKDGVAIFDPQGFFEVKIIQLNDRGDEAELATSGRIPGPLVALRTVRLERITGFPCYLGPIILRVITQNVVAQGYHWNGIGDLVVTLHLDEGGGNIDGKSNTDFRRDAGTRQIVGPTALVGSR